MHDYSKTFEAEVAEFCTHDDLEAPRRGCDFGSKRSEVKVAGYKVGVRGVRDGLRSVGVLV